MEDKKFIKGPNFWFALSLILLGFLFLLDNFYLIDIGDIWHLWPLILIGIGILKLKSTSYQKRSSALTLIILGGFFLLINFDLLDWDDIWQFWPVILILIGLSILFRRYKTKPDSEYPIDSNADDHVDVVAIFSGNDKIITSNNFEGGNVTAVFGGTKLNFGKAEMAKGENIIDIFTMFGGTEIIVPDDWNVIIKGLPLFGGFEDSRHKLPVEQLSTDRYLLIKGFVMFGGIEIKSA